MARMRGDMRDGGGERQDEEKQKEMNVSEKGKQVRQVGNGKAKGRKYE